MSAREANFDGLIGPTHNYAGLALGNVASATNKGAAANPRAAALQGLAKAKAVADLGLVQGVLPPHPRPDFRTLHALGFRGTDAQVIEQAAKQAPDILANCYSASAMWTANAATVAPSTDTPDGRVHFTPANLSSHLHRSLEAPQTARALKTIFADETRFAHHDPLPMAAGLGDEGAANHTRLHADGAGAAHIFVYGLDGECFRARQARRASEGVARLHGLSADRCAFISQSREAIDAGAFHNDVVGVGNGCVYFFHEKSFEDPEAARAEILRIAPYAEFVMAPAEEVPLADTIRSYLFNSQLLTLPDGTMTLVLPKEAEENDAARRFVEKTVEAENSIGAARYFDVRESMRNGGGPACLRLRVTLTKEEVAAVHPGFLLTDENYEKLTGWVEKHYRDRLAPDDLADPALARESLEATEALAQVLGAPELYAS